MINACENNGFTSTVTQRKRQEREPANEGRMENGRERVPFGSGVLRSLCFSASNVERSS